MLAQLYLVEALIGTNKLEEAEDCLKKLPLNSEFAGLIHKLLGDIYHQRKQFRIAVEEYRAAVLGVPELASEYATLNDDIDSDRGDDWENLAEIYQPPLTNVVTEQAERLRHDRTRRRGR
ncbi:MAG: hypothetical protein U1F42_10525 [Candidatus Competibacteraceae bacterium]